MTIQDEVKQMLMNNVGRVCRIARSALGVGEDELEDICNIPPAEVLALEEGNMAVADWPKKLDAMIEFYEREAHIERAKPEEPVDA